MKSEYCEDVERYEVMKYGWRLGSCKMPSSAEGIMFLGSPVPFVRPFVRSDTVITKSLNSFDKTDWTYSIAHTDNLVGFRRPKLWSW